MAKAQPKSSASDPNAYAPQLTKEDLLKMRRTYAKRANQRLVRLERAKSKVSGESYASYGAAQNAYTYLENKGRRRFDEKAEPQMSIKELRKEVAVLQTFLEAKSSTVLGQRAIEEKRQSSFEKGEWGTLWKTQGIRNTPIKFESNKEFFEFLGSETFRSLKKAGFTSEQIIDLYVEGREKQTDKEIVENMQEALEQFRLKGSATLKDFRAKLHLKPLKRRT